jgi:hypothetical protein
MKKTRAGKRRRFTRMEISRDGRQVFRVAIAEDVLHVCGAELGALIRKISPGASDQIAAQAVAVSAEEVIMHPLHDSDDEAYHARARGALRDLFGSLCDSLIADATEMIASERTRRSTEGGN